MATNVKVTLAVTAGAILTYNLIMIWLIERHWAPLHQLVAFIRAGL